MFISYVFIYVCFTCLYLRSFHLSRSLVISINSDYHNQISLCLSLYMDDGKKDIHNRIDKESSEGLGQSKDEEEDTQSPNSYLDEAQMDQCGAAGVEVGSVITEECESIGERSVDGIQDCDGNWCSNREVLRTVLSFKRDSRNFFWGHLMNTCNRINRKVDDRWYPWSGGMMEMCDNNEIKMKNILLHHSHAKIQDICKELGGDFWGNKTTGKIRKLVGGLKHIQKCMQSKKGMKTCWARLKYEGVFKSNILAKKE